jgi:hypothetical protein
VKALMQHARFRQLIGLLERFVLGTNMGVALLAAKWQLGRTQRRKAG